MSSHHFVREEQEPALLIVDAENISLSAIEPLLEWSPTIMVNYSIIDTVISWGIKIDYIICNNVKELSNYDIPPTTKVVVGSELYGKAQDLLNHCSNEALVVVGNFEKNHELAINHMNDVKISFYDGQYRYVYIKEEFRKWLLEEEKLKLYTDSDEYKTSGLVKESNMFRCQNTGVVSIRCDRPFWVRMSL